MTGHRSSRYREIGADISAGGQGRFCQQRQRTYDAFS